jgi:uncharacterized protein YhbP (UPF0306 family)
VQGQALVLGHEPGRRAESGEYIWGGVGFGDGEGFGAAVRIGMTLDQRVFSATSVPDRAMMVTMVNDAAESSASDRPPEALSGFLARHSTMTLAYLDPESGGPAACAVLYAPGVRAGLPVLRFVSAVTTRHGTALATHPEAAFTVQDDGQQWTVLTGLQGSGRVRRLAGTEREQAYAEYLRAFPFVASSETLRGALARTEMWELVPRWVRLIDNAQGFGFQQEWTFSHG